MVLNDTIRPESVAIEDGKMLLKFSRSEVQDKLSTAENEAVLNITGKLNNGKDFAGSDTIRIVRPAGKK
jgi:rRNA pseudouridine-1189 N-methylase Emg1 (Nep1/Mra1 family)